MKILWKRNSFCISPKLCRSCSFPQNFHTSKLREITVFFAVFHYSSYLSLFLKLFLFVSFTSEWYISGTVFFQITPVFAFKFLHCQAAKGNLFLLFVWPVLPLWIKNCSSIVYYFKTFYMDRILI